MTFSVRNNVCSMFVIDQQIERALIMPIENNETNQKAKTERGSSLIEYALLVALIACVCIAAVTWLGKSSLQEGSMAILMM